MLEYSIYYENLYFEYFDICIYYANSHFCEEN